MSIKIPTNDSLERLDSDMAAKSLDGFWRVRLNVPATPKTSVKPFLWKWADVYESLMRAGKLVSPEDCERRVVRLVNPGIEDQRGVTSHTLQLGVQSVNPGDHASNHRHMVVALRFVVKGRGAYTIIEGQKCVMEEGDLILNPRFAWHDHGNETEEAVIWLDGLDTPLLHSLQQKIFESHPDPYQAVTITSDEVGHLFGHAQSTSTPAFPFIHYKWKETHDSLQALKQTASALDRFDAYLLEYKNPVTGGPTLPSIQCAIQALPPGQETDAHRHTSTVIYHVFEGTGTTYVDGQRFHWDKGDSFVVPLWHAHRHINRSSSTEAMLFSMSDSPLLKSLDLYREEPVSE